MRFRIDRGIFEKFQGVNIGVVVAKGMDNTGIAEGVQDKIREQEKEIREKYSTETLSQQPKIGIWRKAYSAFGAKPKENRPSVENLYRLVLNGAELRHINKAVDIYNYISLKHMLPAGGEDLDKIKGDIVLAFAGPDEEPILLLGDKEPRPPHPGEVIYKDGISTICRRWNWREAERAKLTEGTKNCILVLEGLVPVTKEEIEAAAAELKELVEKHCGGRVEHMLLDGNKNETELG